MLPQVCNDESSKPLPLSKGGGVQKLFFNKNRTILQSSPRRRGSIVNKGNPLVPGDSRLRGNDYSFFVLLIKKKSFFKTYFYNTLPW